MCDIALHFVYNLLIYVIVIDVSLVTALQALHIAGSSFFASIRDDSCEDPLYIVLNSSSYSQELQMRFIYVLLYHAYTVVWRPNPGRLRKSFRMLID